MNIDSRYTKKKSIPHYHTSKMPPKKHSTTVPTRELPARKHVLPTRFDQGGPAPKKIKPTQKPTQDNTHEEDSTSDNSEGITSNHRIEERVIQAAPDIINVDDENFEEIAEDTVEKGGEKIVNEISDEQKLSE